MSIKHQYDIKYQYQSISISNTNMISSINVFELPVESGHKGQHRQRNWDRKSWVQVRERWCMKYSFEHSFLFESSWDDKAENDL